MANPWENDPVITSEPEPVEYVQVEPWERDPVEASTQDGRLSADNTLRSLATGVPIIGGALNRIDAATNATLAPLIDPILPDSFQKLDGGTWDERYNQALAIQKGKDEAFHEEHPYVDTGLNITGGVAGTIPAVMAAPAAFGAGSAPLITRSLISAGTGAGMGAADSAVRSDGDPSQVMKGALWGAGAGLVGPAAGQLVGKGVRAAVDYVRNGNIARAAQTSRYALEYLNRAAARDGIDPTALRARLDALGPEAMIADVGPNLQGQAAALANMPGEANAVVRGALNARNAGANARVATAIDDTLGPARVPSALDAEAAANQQALGPAYREAFEQARPYDVGPIAADLERQINVLRGDPQRALQRVRGMLDIHGSNVLDTNPVTMFNTRQAIDGMLKTEADPKVIAALADARQMIDDGLTRAVPQIKEADAAFAELGRQREAIVRGQQVLDSGRTAPRPPELEAMVTEGVQPQGMQIGPSAVPLRLSQGARAEVDRILGSNANDIAALNRLIKREGDWNRARLATLFGPEKAGRLFQALDSELAFANTRNFALGNSATAGRQQAISELGGAGSGSLGVRDSYAAGGVAGLLRAGALRGVDKLLAGALTSAREANNTSLAEAITSKREALIKAMIERSKPTKTPSQLEPVIRALLLSGSASGAR